GRRVPPGHPARRILRSSRNGTSRRSIRARWRSSREGWQRDKLFLEQPHRKVPKVKLLVGAGAVDFTQRVVDGEFQLSILGFHDSQKPGAEIAVVEIGAAFEAAAIPRGRAVQPEG